MIPALFVVSAPRLVRLTPVDMVIVGFYFALVLAIGIYLKQKANTSEDFFLAGREMTAWIAGLAFLSANLGALEVCPSIAEGKPSAEIHPLSIGGKADPVRLVFTARSGPALNASIVDMGDRFRMIVNTVKVIPPEPSPMLPVARAVWVPQPNLKVAAEAWIPAGRGSSHRIQSVAHARSFRKLRGIGRDGVSADRRRDAYS